MHARLLCAVAHARSLAPSLFSDEDQDTKLTRDPVAPAKHSEEALRKVHSFQTLLKLLSGIVRNACRIPGRDPNAPTFDVLTTPNAKQKRALDLLGTIDL